MATVAIIGGGVAGLTAAHELKDRGFKVAMYESRDSLGGKARSFAAVNKSVRGQPAEHGFRFFPNFYQHLNDTMARIPSRHGSVLADLVELPVAMLLRTGRPPFRVPTRRPRHLTEAIGHLRMMMGNPSLGLSVAEISFATAKLASAFSMCNDRRVAELDHVAWADYMEASSMSSDYHAAIVDGLTQNFVAMDARQSSTKTVVNTLARMLRDLWSGAGVDRVLNGPTSDVWIKPWVEHLDQELPERPGVAFHCSARAKSIKYDRNTRSIEGIKFDNEKVVVADYYVLALPLEGLAELLLDKAELLEQHPTLKSIVAYEDEYDPAKKSQAIGLKVSWMSGVVLYLKKDASQLAGHAVYLDSPWALTSIAQTQSWRTKPQNRELLSVIVSDFDRSYGNGSRKKSARDTDNQEEFAIGAFKQILGHLGTETGLSESDLVGWQVDPDLDFDEGPRDVLGQLLSPVAFLQRLGPRFIEGNVSPLFINTVGSWKLRPRVDVGFGNAFLAADYVRTNADLATMEGANEAARRAANAILARAAPDSRPCKIWQYEEPAIFGPARFVDQLLYERNIRNPGVFPAAVLKRVAKGGSMVDDWDN